MYPTLTLLAALALTAPPTFDEVETASYHGVIVPAEAKAELGLAKVTGYWTPTRKDVERFESGLVAFLKKAKPAHARKLHEKVGPYKRHWIGYHRGGRKVLWGNFMCRAHEGWKKHVILVKDGGDCYFRLGFDLKTGRYIGLTINGEA